MAEEDDVSLVWDLKRVVLAALAATLAVAPAQAVGGKQGSTDWPCPQRKVETLGASDLQWEGSLDAVKGTWRQNPEVAKLVAVLANRRVPVEEAVKAMKAFAAGVAAGERAAAMTAVFAGLLETVNDYRRGVISGIERFDKRQKGRALEIETEGTKLNDLKQRADAGDEAAKAEYQKALDLYDWNTRVFEERRQNLPLACEIPPAIDARMFDLVREIKEVMGQQPG